jgi:predicted PurR-regulated permease PerM
VIFKEGEHIAGQVHTLVPDTSPGAIDATLVKNHVSSPARSLILTGVDQLHHTVAQSGTWIAQNGVRVASNLIWIVIIPIVAFYALKDFHLILAKLLLLVPRQRRDLVSTLVSEVSAIFAKYMRGLALVSLLNGLATWGLLAVLHVPNAFTLGAIAGVLYSVPYLGALTTILIVALVTFVAKGLDQMLIVVAANIVLHQIVFDQIISPRILGGHVGLHPILSIVALLVGNALLGIVGMVLAVPVAASIQIAVLALVPKLNQDIDLSSQTAPGTETGSELATKTKEDQVKVDATEELHKNVSDAVEHVEAAIHDGDDATAQAIKTQAIQEHVEKLEADFIEAHQSDPGQK